MKLQIPQFSQVFKVLCLSFIMACAGSHLVLAEQNFYSFSLVDGEGKEIPLSAYKGKVVVLVNLASNSIFKDQVASLNKLQDGYKDKGLVVIGVPSNDFGQGEPGTDAEIQKRYKDDLHAAFPVMAKASVHGKDVLPVYGFLTAGKKSEVPGNGVHWSFTKFIIDRDGKVTARFEPDVTPEDPDFQIAVEKTLAGKMKPLAPLKDEKPSEAGGDEDEEE